VESKGLRKVFVPKEEEVTEELGGGGWRNHRMWSFRFAG